MKDFRKNCWQTFRKDDRIVIERAIVEINTVTKKIGEFPKLKSNMAVKIDLL